MLGRLAENRVPVWLLIGYVIVLGTIVPFICMIGALHYIPATRATVTAMIEPVLAGIVAYAWLGEKIGVTQIAGVVLVLGGIFLAETARISRGLTESQ